MVVLVLIIFISGVSSGCGHRDGGGSTGGCSISSGGGGGGSSS